MLNTNETCYSDQIAKICNLNKPQQPAIFYLPVGPSVPPCAVHTCERINALDERQIGDACSGSGAPMMNASG